MDATKRSEFRKATCGHDNRPKRDRSVCRSHTPAPSDKSLCRKIRLSDQQPWFPLEQQIQEGWAQQRNRVLFRLRREAKSCKTCLQLAIQPTEQCSLELRTEESRQKSIFAG